MSNRTFKLAFFLVAELTLVISQTVFAQEVRYNYDAAGRLISVTDEQGRTITYDYDALGNLLGVRRVDTVGQVAINLVSPASGFVGTQVEIIGKGFSAVANENAIAFNGVSAPVLTASATNLTTQVPIGATTGRITVKTPFGSATSPQDFTVLVATINVSPSQVTLVRGTSQQFTATITGPSDTRVVWSVDDIVGGNATVGTIASDGLYTAPPPSQSAIAPVVVAIKAASLAVPGLSATASVTILPSCTILWTGAGGNNLWQNAANWNTKVLPGVNDDVCVGAGVAITLSSGNQSIRSFNSNSPLTITTGVLNIAASSTLNHNFTLAGGTISGTGNLTVSGQATWTSGTMSGSGTTNFNGTATITANGNVQFLSGGRKLNTAGTTTFTGPNGEFRTGPSETINNSGVWIDETTGTSRIGNVFGGSFEQATFNNTGTFRKTGSAVTTIISVFNNTSSGAGTGVVDLQSATLNLNGGGGTANSGSSFTGAGATTLGFGSRTYNLQSGSNVSVATFALIGGGVIVNVGGSYSATATSIIGTANFIAGAVVSTAGALTLSTGTANFNTGALVPLTTLTLNAGGELSGADAVTVSGQATWNSGTMSGTGTTTFNGDATIAANNSAQNLLAGRTLNIVGTLTFTGNNGDFRTGSSETINIFGVWLDQTTGTTNIRNPQGGTQATFRITGTFRKTGTATTNIASVFNNSGTVETQAGLLSFSGGYTQTAGETKLNGGAFSSTTTLNIQGGKLTGAGTVTANVSNAGQVSPGASPGILNITGNYTQTSAGALNIEIGGLTAGTEFDRLAISGTSTLNGTLNVSLINGFTPNPGDTFQIMTFGSRSGNFTTTNAPGFGVSVNATNVTVAAP